MRESVNSVVKHDTGRVNFIKLNDGLWWRAKMVSGPGLLTPLILEIDFIPNIVVQKGTVRLYSVNIPVDFKSYRWAVHKLSEYQIMEKLTQ